MSYFVTIYTDPLLDFEGITHSFIGLTHKSPDELEKDNSKWYEKNILVLSMETVVKFFLDFVEWKQIKKWYLTI